MKNESSIWWTIWLIVVVSICLVSNACKKKNGPSRIQWQGLPSLVTPTCGDESAESRVYTCVFENVIYTCIQDREDVEVFVCAPKLFEKPALKDVLAEKPIDDAGVGKDSQ